MRKASWFLSNCAEIIDETLFRMSEVIHFVFLLFMSHNNEKRNASNPLVFCEICN